MFHHVKELQFNARVSGPDPKFARLLLEQFGGANGELKAAMQYFVQAFSVRQPQPKLYDMLMDIATEEFSHLEIVGATITMLLGPVSAELKQAFKDSGLMEMVSGGSAARDALVHQALMNPQFFVLSGGGPTLTDCNGNPWTSQYVNANGDPTVDLRSDIAAESRAKIVYEYLLQFTDDKLVQESLQFLMTREIAHFQTFSAALDSVQPNFPPGVLQGDARYTHAYFNMSDGASARGPWNEGKGPWSQGKWTYVEDPISTVRETDGLTQMPQTAPVSNEDLQETGKKIGKMRFDEISSSVPKGTNQWSDYPQEQLESPRRAG
jgi:Mn-containing catalase